MELRELLKKSRKALEEKKAERLAASQKTKNRRSFRNKGMPDALRNNLRKWGAKTFNDLMKVNTADRKFAYLGREEKEKVKHLKECVDIAVLTAQMFDKTVEETEFYQNELKFALKAFGIGAGDEGFEWIPTVVADSFIDEFNLERKVTGLFFSVKMPSNPFNWPVLSNGAIARRVGTATAINKQVFNTKDTIQFDAQKFASRHELPEELNEDSAPDIIRALRQEVIEGDDKAKEIAVLEGDTAGTLHNFSQLPDVAIGTTIASISAETPETAFDGIRKRVLAANGLVAGSSIVDAGASALTDAEPAAARAKLGKFGVDPSQIAWIFSPKTYNQALNLDDVRTLDVFGPKATVLSGELAKLDGAPVVVSEYLREDTDATGVNSAVPANNVKGSVIVINRKRWFMGQRRAIQVRVERNKTEFDVLDIVSFSREAFQAVLKADGSNYGQESSAAMIINIAI